MKVSEIEQSEKPTGLYRVKKLFIGGVLKGIESEFIGGVPFTTGFVCSYPAAGGSPYKIISCKPVKVGDLQRKYNVVLMKRIKKQIHKT